MSNIFISLQKVESFLSEDKKCNQELKKEIIQMLNDIDSKQGRNWIFTPEDKKYYIDEYNQYKDLVKTSIFKI